MNKSNQKLYLLDILKANLGLIPSNPYRENYHYTPTYIGTWPKDVALEIARVLKRRGYKVVLRGRGSRAVGKRTKKYRTGSPYVRNPYASDLPIANATEVALYVRNRWKGSIRLKLIKLLLKMIIWYTKKLNVLGYTTEEKINSLIEDLEKVIAGKNQFWYHTIS